MGELKARGLIAMPLYQSYFLVELDCGHVVEVHDIHPQRLLHLRCSGCDVLGAPVDWVEISRG